MRAFTHFFAPLQHDRLEAHLRQQQRCKNTAGAKADDDGSQCRRCIELHHRVIVLVGHRANVRMRFKLFEQRSFERGGQLYITDVHQQQLLLARVVTAFVDGVADEIARGDSQRSGDQRRQRVLVVVKRQLEFGDADHVGCRSLFRGSVFRIKPLF